MIRSKLSEKKLVVVLFVMVIVTFFFAQADSSKIEKMYLNNNPSVTTSIDQTPGSVNETSVKQIKPVVASAVQLR